MTRREAEFSVQEVPSLWDYSNYMFCLPTAILGPSFEFRTYMDFVDKKRDFSKLQKFENWREGIKRYFQGYGCMILHYGFSYFWPRYDMTKPEFIDTSVPMKYLYIYAGLQ